VNSAGRCHFYLEMQQGFGRNLFCRNSRIPSAGGRQAAVKNIRLKIKDVYAIFIKILFETGNHWCTGLLVFMAKYAVRLP